MTASASTGGTQIPRNGLCGGELTVSTARVVELTGRKRSAKDRSVRLSAFKVLSLSCATQYRIATGGGYSIT